MRCRKHDEGDRGCIAEAGHKGKCAIRPNPDDPRPETWPCAVEGCDRRVKSEGARCPVHRGMLNRGVPRRGQSAKPDVGDRRAHIGRAAPNCSTRSADGDPAGAAPRVRDGQDLVKRHIEALTVQDVIANKAARKALVGLARAILEMFDKPEPRGT